MKKRLLIILGLMPFMNFVFCQEIPVDIIERVNNTDYIFEGEVINSEPYYTNSGQYIHTSNTVDITKRLKGDIQCGTIEIITKGGRIGNEDLDVSHALTLSLGSKGIFLCNDTDRPVSVVDFYPETNTEVLEATYENQSFIRYWWDGQEYNAADLWLNYDSLALVYNATQAITGLQYIDCSQQSTATIGGDINATQTYDSVIAEPFPTYSENTADSIRLALKERYLNHLRIESGDRANDKVIYQFDNITMTGIITKYLEFDVMMSDDYGAGYLELGTARIEYDPLVFGNSVVANSNIVVTRGDLIFDSNCYTNPSPSDENSYTFIVFTGALTGTTCREPILTTPRSLFHVKMEMLNCETPSNIALVDTAWFFGPSYVIASSAYTPAPASPTTTYYDFIEHTKISSSPTCIPIINDFNPKNVAGGIGDIVTIQGSNFGATRGSGNVFLKNADDGGVSEVFLDAVDFISWSNTEIKIKVPSYDTTTSITVFSTQGKPAGTGIFRVVTNSGLSAQSNLPLNIKYSITTIAEKKPIAMAPLDAFNQKLVFHCDTAVANYQGGAMKAVIDKAIRDWTCLTGVDWSLGADTVFSGNVLADGLCVIKFSQFFNGTLAGATTRKGGCANSTDSSYYSSEVDIEIESVYTWFCDTTNAPMPFGQQDLYAVMLHEFGHGNLLNHVNDVNAIMFHSTPGVGTRPIDLPNDASCDEGGNWIMDFTTNTANSVICPGKTNMVRVVNPPCSTLGTNELQGSSFELNLYPNPTTQFLNLDITSLLEKNITINIIDTRGRLVLEQDELLHNGFNTFGINIEDLPQGIYVVSIFSDNKKLNISKKLIKNEE